MGESTLNKDALEENILDFNFIKKKYMNSLIENIDKIQYKLKKLLINKDLFLSNCLNSFCEEKFNKKYIKKYFCKVDKLLKLMEKNIVYIRGTLGHNLDIPMIDNIEYLYDRKEAIITLSSDEIILFRENGFREQLAVNKIIERINISLPEEEKLYIQPIVSLDNGGFMNIINQRLQTNNKLKPNYYFKCGEILAVVYILGGQNNFEYDLTCINGEPVIQNIADVIEIDTNMPSFQSAESVVRFVIECSVYNINFLDSTREYLDKQQLLEYRSGFKRIYNILVENKTIFIKLMGELFKDKNSYLAKVVTNINHLNKKDLARQLNIIDAKFNNIKSNIFKLTISKEYEKNRIDFDHILKTASKLGEDIIQDSIIGYNNSITSRSWITLKKDCNESFTVCPSNDNPYEGNSGIALFFLYLGVVSKNEYFIATSIEAMESFVDDLRARIKENKISKEFFMLANIGIYTFAKMYLITGKEIVKEYIEEIIVCIRKFIYSYDETNQLKSFCALLAVAEREEFLYLKEKILDICNIVYEKLEKKFNIDILNSDQLLDINEAIIFCARFANISKNHKADNVIDKLLNNQRKDNIILNMNKALKSTKFYSEMLLSRLVLKKYCYVDDLMDVEVELLIKHFTNNSFEEAIDYYDGAIRNLEILEFAAEILDDKNLNNSCKNAFNKLLAYIEHFYLAENGSYLEKKLSLISGVVGCGYTLIRHYNKNIVPSILWFD
ncbi:lanthionine synthetase LanC family protein [Clostridium manihotivorum]|uniref:Uncharacterized protein n=1 Tax=Clostridium manihotivorum TaxID=2320868 RepID=A0A3R5QRM8_9CLOT|nr:lanthionine synthetase LanC family protein [Clostridium manihotivorum]QAA31130.1 hypothetical protein C1I91_05315 [Clostridium manihotivorum]